MPSLRLCPAPLLLAFALVAHPSISRADLWAYVDDQGHSHVADRQVDPRYKLFFKGATTLDAPNAQVAAQVAERARAQQALAGTRLYARATDDAQTRRFEPLIERASRASGLDAALVKAIIAVESAFDARAVSAKGAVGLMQVLPETGERYGITGDARLSTAQKLADPATNLRIGTRYLRDLLARFPNDLSLALAAYNAGEGSVATHDNTVPPFAETREYVRLVQLLYAVYRPEPAPQMIPVRIVRAKTRTAAIGNAPPWRPVFSR